MRTVSDKICRETQNTHFVFSNFFFENRAVYEIMCKNIAERGRLRMTIWHMRIACWIPKATNTHSENVTHRFSTTTVVTRTRLNVTLYVQYLSCYTVIWPARCVCWMDWFSCNASDPRGHAVTQFEALRYKPEGREFDSRRCHWNFSLPWSFLPHYGPGVDSVCKRNEYQEYFLGGKDGRCVGLTTLPHSCADCLEIWEPQPPGTLRACPDLYRDCFAVLSDPRPVRAVLKFRPMPSYPDILVLFRSIFPTKKQ